MGEEKKQIPRNNNTKEPKLETAGYKPIIEGYQPTQGQIDSSKPPQGGSGVPNPKVVSSETNKNDVKK